MPEILYLHQISSGIILAMITGFFINSPGMIQLIETEPSYEITEPWGPAAFGYTYLRPDGNRVVPGRGSLPDSANIDIPLSGRPLWIAAASVSDGSIWVVVMDTGQVQAFMLIGEHVEPLEIFPDQLPSGMPPVLEVRDGIPTVITPPTSETSNLTHPLILNESGRLVFIEKDGDIVIMEGDESVSLDVDALPDARILADEGERLLLLSGPSARYTHGILGDTLEASSITLIETLPEPRVAMTLYIPGGRVVEGLAPIWADLTGDGKREIIVTVSDALEGAQVLVFDEDGEISAEGPSIGSGYRWRHQLAAAPFGPGGELELADILTPHIGGVVEFYRLEGRDLKIIAQVRGYTSHVIGSRNLDMAAAGDFDGDGRVELLVPNQRLSELGGIRRTADGAEVAWTVSVGGRISTNLVGVALHDGSMVVGVGRDDGVLRLWLQMEENLCPDDADYPCLTGDDDCNDVITDSELLKVIAIWYEEDECAPADNVLLQLINIWSDQRKANRETDFG